MNIENKNYKCISKTSHMPPELARQISDTYCETIGWYFEIVIEDDDGKLRLRYYIDRYEVLDV